MKRILWLPLALFLVISVTTQAQFSINLTVLEPLPRLDFGALIIGNDLTGAPTIFRVDINKPASSTVYIKGELYWIDVDPNTQGALSTFTTKPITVLSFTNNELGNAVRLESHSENQGLINKNLQKGKPTGVYSVRLQLWEKLSTGDLKRDETQRDLSFLNPTQTLAIILPTQGMNCDPGNVVAIWNSISGATQYRVRANIRRLPTQSLEEALASGNPIINDRVVNATTVNLRTILDREWAVGQEIVLQVAALIPGVGQEPIYSQPISFLLTNNTQTLGGGTGGGGGTTPVTIIPLSPTQIVQIGNILSAQPALVNILPPAVLQALVSGNLALTLRNGDGSPITPQQLQATLNYLQANPSQLLNIIYRRP